MINADKGAGRSVGSPLSAQGAGSIEFSKLAPSRRHRKVGMHHTIAHINLLQKQQVRSWSGSTSAFHSHRLGSEGRGIVCRLNGGA